MSNDKVKAWMKERGLTRHIIDVTATGHIGMNTGRLRYRVECLSCGHVINDNTTGPGALIKTHLDNQEIEGNQ